MTYPQYPGGRDSQPIFVVFIIMVFMFLGTDDGADLQGVVFHDEHRLRPLEEHALETNEMWSEDGLKDGRSKFEFIIDGVYDGFVHEPARQSEPLEGVRDRGDDVRSSLGLRLSRLHTE